MECIRKEGHAPSTGYLADGCRCDECREAGLAVQKAYRHRHPERLASRSKDRYDRQKELISSIKLEKGCARCGYNEHAEALDFHHTGEKLFTIASKTNRSMKKLLEEIDKCIVLCANCHRIEHAL